MLYMGRCSHTHMCTHAHTCTHTHTSPLETLLPYQVVRGDGRDQQPISQSEFEDFLTLYSPVFLQTSLMSPFSLPPVPPPAPRSEPTQRWGLIFLPTVWGLAVSHPERLWFMFPVVKLASMVLDSQRDQRLLLAKLPQWGAGLKGQLPRSLPPALENNHKSHRKQPTPNQCFQIHFPLNPENRKFQWEETSFFL